MMWRKPQVGTCRISLQLHQADLPMFISEQRRNRLKNHDDTAIDEPRSLLTSALSSNVVGHVGYYHVCKLHSSFDRSRRTSGIRSKPASARPRPLRSAAVRFCWPVPRASTPPRWPAPCAATIKRSATPFTRSTNGGWQRSNRHLQPHRPRAVFDTQRRERLRALLHQSPRLFGRSTSVWTLALAAEVSYAQGLTPRQVSGEAIRLALQQLGVRWKRAKHWITSPDPPTSEKKRRDRLIRLAAEPSDVGARLCR